PHRRRRLGRGSAHRVLSHAREEAAPVIRRSFAALACVAALACAARDDSAAPGPTGESGPALEATTDAGKVTATVRLTPAKPRVGDVLPLTLTARAQAGVVLELPPFGEALGRFTVVKFTPRTDTASDGSTTHTQIYELTANGSG